MNLKERFSVGIAGSMSGRQTDHSSLFRQASERLINAGFPTILVDDEATPKGAVTAARRLIEAGVDAVIGHFNSACAEAVAPLYREKKIVLLLPAASQSDLRIGNGVYRLCSTDIQQADLLAKTATSLSSEKPIELAIDRSAYSFRILRALKTTRMRNDLIMTDIDLSPRYGIDLRIILANSSNLARSHSALIRSNWNGNALFADEAHIDQFLGYADAERVNSFVVGPSKSYSSLTMEAVEWLISWKTGKEEIFPDWLDSSGMFDSTGQYLMSGWCVFNPARCFDAKDQAQGLGMRYRFIPSLVNSKILSDKQI